MNRPKILIHHVSHITPTTDCRCFPNMELLCFAFLAIVSDGTHFRCVKNRYDTPANDEKIPLEFLPAYIMRYEQYFTKEDLVEALIYEMTS